MADPTKRKEGSGDCDGGRKFKKAKRGTGGKWKMPHHQDKPGKIEPGDQGIWATCAKGQEGKATRELLSMFEECAQRFYNLPPSDVQVNSDEEEKDSYDIESSIRREVTALSREDKMFTPVKIEIQCVLFFKTKAPINPVKFVHRICKEIVAAPEIRKMRYVNRLTPVSMTAKATLSGLEDLAKSVLGEVFDLADEDVGNRDEAEKLSYAIRPTIRRHKSLKRDDVINKVASLIGKQHKVNLTKPDKIIIVDIFTTICGTSVLDGDWEALKRYNLNQLYHQNGLEAGAGEEKDIVSEKREKELAVANGEEDERMRDELSNEEEGEDDGEECS